MWDSKIPVEDCWPSFPVLLAPSSMSPWSASSASSIFCWQGGWAHPSLQCVSSSLLSLGSELLIHFSALFRTEGPKGPAVSVCILFSDREKNLYPGTKERPEGREMCTHRGWQYDWSSCSLCNVFYSCNVHIFILKSLWALIRGLFFDL